MNSRFPRPLGVACAVLLLGAALITAVAADRPPNIVLIISDDQAWTDYGFMGHPHIQTPNLDKLASESLLFTRGYVPTSLCRPSLATMITGLYAHQHKITGNEPPIPEGPNKARAKQSAEYKAQCQEMIDYIDKSPTLPKMLAEKGYLSHQSGKWWEGHYSRGGFTHGMTHGDPKRGGRHGDEGLKIGREGMEPVTGFIDMAVEQDKPFFIWYAPFLPHTPHTPPDRILTKYQDKTDSEFVAKYWAMCEWFDETCGQLLDHLDQKGIAENTIVLYVTDNGWIQEEDKNGYAAGSKRSPYDGGLRTPIMVKWPAQLKPRKIDTPVSSIDLAPTVLAAVGLEKTESMQGLDLRDLDAVTARNTIFGDVHLHNAVDIHDPAKNLTYRWCLQDPWKLLLPNAENVTTPSKETGTGNVELYNVQEDPFERNDLAGKNPEKVKELTKVIDDWWKAE